MLLYEDHLLQCACTLPISMGQPAGHGSSFQSLPAPKQYDVECQHSLRPAPALMHPQSPPLTLCTQPLFLLQLPFVARCLGPQPLLPVLVADCQTSCSTWLVWVCTGETFDASVYPAATTRVAEWRNHGSSHCGIGVCPPCLGYTCITSYRLCCRNDKPMLLGKLAGASAAQSSKEGVLEQLNEERQVHKIGRVVCLVLH